MRAERFSERSRRVAKSGIRPINQNSNEIVKYVDTANTPQTRGLRNCGQDCMAFGYGTSQQTRQARPSSMTAERPAAAPANGVIASAKRLMELRHGGRNKRRIAEIRVPACPIPSHQTKLTMANPQPTGMFTPQMPMPRMNK